MCGREKGGRRKRKMFFSFPLLESHTRCSPKIKLSKEREKEAIETMIFGKRFGMISLLFLALAATLVLLSLPAFPAPTLLAGLGGPHIMYRSGAYSADSQFSLPLGSLAEQAYGIKAAASPLAFAEEELTAEKRQLLRRSLQTAQKKEEDISKYESARVARMRQWREQQQAQRHRAQIKREDKKKWEHERQKALFAIHGDGQLGGHCTICDCNCE